MNLAAKIHNSEQQLTINLEQTTTLRYQNFITYFCCLYPEPVTIKKKYISLSVLVLTVLITLFSSLKSEKWKENRIIVLDGKIYYSYLPALFIYNDLSFDRSPELMAIFGKEWKNTAPNGNKVVKMTMGNAVCWLPFFWAGHLLATFSEHPADGFSPPYHLMIQLAGIFYLLLGLLFLRKLLLRYFDDTTVAVTLAIVVFGTNLYYYAAYEPYMSHVNSFCMVTLFLYFSLRWLDRRTISNSLLTGLSLGLILLIRPTNFIVILIPLILWLFHIRQRGMKWHYLKGDLQHGLIIAVTTLLTFSPQMIYWQVQSGSLLYNSYHEEGFFFLDPHLIEGLFSYRKGWLIYSPLMALSIAGIFFMKGRLAPLRLPLLVFSAFFIYIIFSWWCWWYGGSYGSRAMIDIYGVLAVPIAAAIREIVNKNRWVRLAAALIIGFFIYLNFFQTAQYRQSLLHFDGMTKKAYWTLFLEDSWPQDYDRLIDRPDYQKALKGID